MILAGIDIGTNTLRLLIAEIGPDSYREIHSERKITRLGEQLDHNSFLSQGAQERSIRALAEFAAIIDAHKPVAVSALGTSALRNAQNSRVFLREVQSRTGLTVTIIDGKEEARLTLLGVSRALGEEVLSAGSIVADIGGGSTEIISRDPAFETSLPLGAVYLTERFLRQDPPLAEELDRMRTATRKILQTSLPGWLRPLRLAGTAGTITTLASIDQRLEVYQPARINGAVLSRNKIDQMVVHLFRSSLSQRRSIPGLESGREDIILAGAVVVQEIMDQWRLSDLLVSDWGLREGIVFDLYGKMVTR
jgi:exopolyphosphatase/guanosine-5'-triphosphate,3'-diphosphate pyrophosphatase